MNQLYLMKDEINSYPIFWISSWKTFSKFLPVFSIVFHCSKFIGLTHSKTKQTKGERSLLNEKVPAERMGNFSLSQLHLTGWLGCELFKNKREKMEGGSWCVISWCTALRFVHGEVTRWYFRSQHHQPSGSNWSGVYVLVVSSFHLVGVWLL